MLVDTKIGKIVKMLCKEAPTPGELRFHSYFPRSRLVHREINPRREPHFEVNLSKLASVLCMSLRLSLRSLSGIQSVISSYDFMILLRKYRRLAFAFFLSFLQRINNDLTSCPVFEITAVKDMASKVYQKLTEMVNNAEGKGSAEGESRSSSLLIRSN